MSVPRLVAGAHTLERRQGYSAVTGGLSKGANSLHDSASASLSRNQIIGVVVAILVVAILAISCTWWCCVRSARRRDARHERENAESSNAAAVPLQRQRYSANNAETSRGGASLGMPMAQVDAVYALPKHKPQQQKYASARRGSDGTIESHGDDDDWKHQPLTQAENSSYRQSAMPMPDIHVDLTDSNDSYFVPPYQQQQQQQQQQHGRHSHLPPPYGGRSPMGTPTERHPMRP